MFQKNRNNIHQGEKEGDKISEKGKSDTACQVYFVVRRNKAIV